MANFLTLKQAAEEIGISAKALRKRCANRELSSNARNPNQERGFTCVYRKTARRMP